MNCKNCNTELKPEHKYCNDCGAMVVNERITLKHLSSSLLDSLGWDNRFFVTFRDLISRPQFVFEKYLNGTRKKHTNPFVFFAIGAAISVLLFNIFSDELISITNNATIKQSETIIDTLPTDEVNMDSNDKVDFIAERQSFNSKLYDFMFENYYYLSFLLLPFYALIAFIVFGKPNNYSEHLVINAYIQGLLFFFSLLLFIISLITRTDLFTIGTFLITIVYYSYAYKKFHRLSFGRLLLKILKFFAIVCALLIITVMIGFFMAMLKDG